MRRGGGGGMERDGADGADDTSWQDECDNLLAGHDLPNRNPQWPRGQLTPSQWPRGPDVRVVFGNFTPSRCPGHVTWVGSGSGRVTPLDFAFFSLPSRCSPRPGAERAASALDRPCERCHEVPTLHHEVSFPTLYASTTRSSDLLFFRPSEA